MQHAQRADAKNRTRGGRVQKGHLWELRKLGQGGPEHREPTAEHERDPSRRWGSHSEGSEQRKDIIDILLRLLWQQCIKRVQIWGLRVEEGNHAKGLCNNPSDRATYRCAGDI